MGIQKDAGELLKLCYDKYQKGEALDRDMFKEISGWDSIRINNAVKYLFNLRLIYGLTSDQGSFKITEVLPEGINIVENVNKFESTFGFKINLGVVSFSWDIKK